MVELVKDEAKLHISNGIEKASGAMGVDIKVRKQKSPHFTDLLKLLAEKFITNIYFVDAFRLHAKLSKNKWTDSTVTLSTV